MLVNKGDASSLMLKATERVCSPVQAHGTNLEALSSDKVATEGEKCGEWTMSMTWMQPLRTRKWSSVEHCCKKACTERLWILPAEACPTSRLVRRCENWDKAIRPESPKLSRGGRTKFGVVG